MLRAMVVLPVPAAPNSRKTCFLLLATFLCQSNTLAIAWSCSDAFGSAVAVGLAGGAAKGFAGPMRIAVRPAAPAIRRTCSGSSPGEGYRPLQAHPGRH